MYEKFIFFCNFNFRYFICLILNGTIYVDNDFLKRIAVTPLSRPQRNLDLELLLNHVSVNIYYYKII